MGGFRNFEIKLIAKNVTSAAPPITNIKPKSLSWVEKKEQFLVLSFHHRPIQNQRLFRLKELQGFVCSW